MQSGQKGRDPDLVQKMLRLREAKNGTEIDELLQARASGHKRVSMTKCQNGSRSLRMAGLRPRKQKHEKLKDKKKNHEKKRVRGFCTSLKWKVSWRKRIVESREREHAAGQRSVA